jgi:hypothetical protein
LGHHVGRRRLLNILHRRCSILLRLRIGYALLIRLIVLLLSGSILLRISFLLAVAYYTGSADDDRCAHGSGTHTSDRPSDHSSSG